MTDVIFPDELVEDVKAGGIGVIPTDTMYGVVGSALNKATVERMFELRNRDKDKPFLMLISNINDVEQFGIELSDSQKKILERIWPGPVSVEMKVTDSAFEYLHRGTGRFAMRLPANDKLRELIAKTGPLIAPSANTAGDKPAETMDEAWEYFPELEFYIDGGTLPNNPSTLVSIEGDKLKVWRQGEWQVPEDLLFV